MTAAPPASSEDAVPLDSAALPVDSAALRKARGAFFTPEPVARFVTDWAVRGAGEHVLEPSCGEASFLLAAVDRLSALGGTGTLDGVELHPASAEAARELLRRAGVDATVRVGDFFRMEPTARYDAVIGNPPYVRYQDFSGDARARSRASALRAGVSLTNLASSWAAFSVHSALFCKPGGRLGLVLPAELLSVNYAAPVRRFLLDSFARVNLVLFTERVFPGVLEEVVLLLADGYREGPTDHASVYQVRNAAELTPELDGLAPARVWRPQRPEDKWTPSMLPGDALAAYRELLAGPGFAELESWGDTTLGMVSGNNKYFALSPARADELGLRGRELLRLSPPGSRHLRGLALTPAALRQLGAGGSATLLFRPAGEPSPAGRAYIRVGEQAGVHRAFKCRVRSPWWRVPLVPPADLLVTYMNADTPRLCENSAGAHHLNSVHGLYLRPELAELGRRQLAIGSLTSLTLMGAELVGRAYGGGMLKLEPREADRLPVPSPALLAAASADLAAIRPAVLRDLRAGRLLAAVERVDEVLLRGHLGLSAATTDTLGAAHRELRARRMARGGEARAHA